jgi:hypothetical protein
VLVLWLRSDFDAERIAMTGKLESATSEVEVLNAAYTAMTDDQVRESEAAEWSEALIADVGDDPRPSDVSTNG